MLVSTGTVRDAHSGLTDAWEMFDAAKAKPKLDALTEFIDAKAYATSISATRSQFELLVKSEILSPSIKNTKVKAVWNSAEGHALLEGNLKNAVQISQAKHSLVHLAKSAQRHKIEPGPFIKAIQEGQIAHIGNLAGSAGYASIHVNDKEVGRILVRLIPMPRALKALQWQLASISRAGCGDLS